MARWHTTMPPIRTADLQDILESGLLIFPGSTDRTGKPLLFANLALLTFLENNSATEIKSFFSYFVSISKEDARENGYVFVVDCTKRVASSVSDFLELLHDYFPGKICKIYVVLNSPHDGYIGKAYLRMKSMLSSMQGNSEFPRVDVNSFTELHKFVDPSQIPSIFEGRLNFDQKLWVETRIELDKIVSDYHDLVALICIEQEHLIKPIPKNIAELTEFEETIAPLREKVYVPSQQTLTRAEGLVAEEKLSRDGSSGLSRFGYCPLSTFQIIDSNLLGRIFEKLGDISDNFLNLWGLQLQKINLEKFTQCRNKLLTKLRDLDPTLEQCLKLSLSNIEPQFHFYNSIYTTFVSDDHKLYESTVEAHTCLRDWNFTPRLPFDTLDIDIDELNHLWSKLTKIVNIRKKVLDVYFKTKDLLYESVGGYEKCYKLVEFIVVSDDRDASIALPIKHHSITNSIQDYCNHVKDNLGKIDVSFGVIDFNVDVTSFNNQIKQVISKAKSLSDRNNQCLAIKEQISLFFISIREIQDWLIDVGHPFISTQTLGNSLEESRIGKTSFLKFIASSGLDSTNQRMNQCSKTLSVILNSKFLNDRGVNILKDSYARTEVDWKGFGLEVQEHSRDLELSIEFYEAAQNVDKWLSDKEENNNLVLHTELEKLDEMNLNEITKEKMDELYALKESMSDTSKVMDECHSKYIELSASSNNTLRHIRTAKSKVDSNWTKFSEKLRTAEKLLEKKYKEYQEPDRESLTDASVSSMESLDFETEAEHTAFRNTKLLIQELVNTEKKYVEDLRDIIVGYKDEFESQQKCPKYLKSNSSTIFGNIEDIYHFHNKIFLGELEKAVESNTIGSVFCNNIANFDMYATYCKNKPKSESFLSQLPDTRFIVQCQKNLNHILDLSSYLLKPVQRIMKYHLILEKLLKYTPDRSAKRRIQLEEALDIMERVPRYANDAIHLMGLEGYNGNTESLGQLLLQESFLVYVNGQKKATPRQIFIFEHAMLFSKPMATKAPVSRSKTLTAPQPKYSFKNHVPLSEVGITRYLPEDKNNVQFQIQVYRQKDQRNTGEIFVIQAASTAIRDQWIDKLEELLFIQFESMKNRAASNML